MVGNVPQTERMKFSFPVKLINGGSRLKLVGKAARRVNSFSAQAFDHRKKKESWLNFIIPLWSDAAFFPCLAVHLGKYRFGAISSNETQEKKICGF